MMKTSKEIALRNMMGKMMIIMMGTLRKIRSRDTMRAVLTNCYTVRNMMKHGLSVVIRLGNGCFLKVCVAHPRSRAVRIYVNTHLVGCALQRHLRINGQRERGGAVASERFVRSCPSTIHLMSLGRTV